MCYVYVAYSVMPFYVSIKTCELRQIILTKVVQRGHLVHVQSYKTIKNLFPHRSERFFFFLCIFYVLPHYYECFTKLSSNICLLMLQKYNIRQNICLAVFLINTLSRHNYTGQQ